MLCIMWCPKFSKFSEKGPGSEFMQRSIWKYRTRAGLFQIPFLKGERAFMSQTSVWDIKPRWNILCLTVASVTCYLCSDLCSPVLCLPYIRRLVGRNYWEVPDLFSTESCRKNFSHTVINKQINKMK